MFVKVRKRDGREASFDEAKITEAIFKAAKAVGGAISRWPWNLPWTFCGF